MRCGRLNTLVVSAKSSERLDRGGFRRVAHDFSGVSCEAAFDGVPVAPLEGVTPAWGTEGMGLQ